MRPSAVGPQSDVRIEPSAAVSADVPQLPGVTSAVVSTDVVRSKAGKVAERTEICGPFVMDA